MKPFSNSRVLSSYAIATLLLAGCGGGSPIVSTPFSSTSSNATGLARLPSAQTVLPEAIHPDVNSVVTVLYKGRPVLQGSWVKLEDDKGKEVAFAKTGPNGNATLRKVPQQTPLRLWVSATYEACVRKGGTVHCHQTASDLIWPPQHKLQPPPFPAALECDINKYTCKKI